MPATTSEGVSSGPAVPGVPAGVTLAPTPTRPSPPPVELGLLAVLALLASLMGIIGVAYSIYAFKFLGTHYILHLPSRVFFVLSLGLAVVPFLLVIFAQRIPYLVLLIPTALCFLLYPLLEPHGMLYGQDAIFNFQFASTFLTHSLYVGGANTTGEAIAYSYYPGSGIFNAEGSIYLGIPLTSSYPWVLPLTRLLILPPLIFAIGRRLLGARAGVLGVVVYMAVPSITFNDLVQQEFAVLYFALALMSITFLLYAPPGYATPLRILVVVFSSFVILSHHVTSYVMGTWLAGLAIIPFLMWGRPVFQALRSAVAALRYFALFLIYTFFLTAGVLLSQLTILERNILLLLSNAPLSAKTAAAGNTYPVYQLVWIIAGIVIVTLLAVATLRESMRGKVRPYLATSLLMSTVVLLIAFVLFPTGYAFVAIRTTEYALIFAAPAAGWYLLRGVIPAIHRGVRRQLSGSSQSLRTHPARWIAPSIAVVLVLFLFTAGNLVPGLSRDQFQPPNLLAVNSPMHLTAADYQDGVWARTHLNTSAHVWGDLFVWDVFSGIGGLVMPYDTYAPFNGTTPYTNQLGGAGLLRLAIGDYVITDIYDTQLTPTYWGPASDQPSGPLSAAQLVKFNDTAYFSVIFVDSTFTIYELTHTLPTYIGQPGA